MATFPEHLAWFDSESQRCEELLRGASPADFDRPVTSCPGWSLTNLVAHLGGVYAWVDEIVASSERAASSTDEPTSAAAAMSSFVSSHAALRSRFASIDMADLGRPTWNWSGRNKVVGFWPRRMAHETAVHRLDIEDALGINSAPIPFALDTLSEFLDDLAPRWMGSRSPVPAGDLHIHATDPAPLTTSELGEWHLHRADTGSYVSDHQHAKAAAAITGSAHNLVRAIHRRPHAEVSLHGDSATLDAWLDALAFS